jgi:hypothetical protein
VNDYPFLFVDECPDCGEPLTAIVDRVVGTPKATGGRMSVPISTEMFWMRACEHILVDENSPDET